MSFMEILLDILSMFGGWSNLLAILLAIIVIDIITGVVLAAFFKGSSHTQSGGLSSKYGYQGILKKCMILLVIMLGGLLDTVFQCEVIRSAIIIYYIANEGLSVLENTAAMGVPYPKFVLNILDSMKKKADDGPAVDTDQLEIEWLPKEDEDDGA